MPQERCEPYVWFEVCLANKVRNCTWDTISPLLGLGSLSGYGLSGMLPDVCATTLSLASTGAMKCQRYKLSMFGNALIPVISSFRISCAPAVRRQHGSGRATRAASPPMFRRPAASPAPKAKPKATAKRGVPGPGSPGGPPAPPVPRPHYGPFFRRRREVVLPVPNQQDGLCGSRRSELLE